VACIKLQTALTPQAKEADPNKTAISFHIWALSHGIAHTRSTPKPKYLPPTVQTSYCWQVLCRHLQLLCSNLTASQYICHKPAAVCCVMCLKGNIQCQQHACRLLCDMERVRLCGQYGQNSCEVRQKGVPEPSCISPTKPQHSPSLIRKPCTAEPFANLNPNNHKQAPQSEQKSPQISFCSSVISASMNPLGC
jgi:hypothetical protein